MLSILSGMQPTSSLTLIPLSADPSIYMETPSTKTHSCLAAWEALNPHVGLDAAAAALLQVPPDALAAAGVGGGGGGGGDPLMAFVPQVLVPPPPLANGHAPGTGEGGRRGLLRVTVGMCVSWWDRVTVGMCVWWWDEGVGIRR